MYIFSKNAKHHVSSKNYLPVFAFFLGSSLYGNINIFGIVATEAAPVHLSGTSHAIVSLASSSKNLDSFHIHLKCPDDIITVGAVLAGYPFSVIAHYHGWSGVFILLEILCSVCLIILLLTRNISGKIAQKED